MANNGEVQLGQEVQCEVTGFKGIATVISVYMFGCRRIGVQPPVGADGKIPDNMDIDEPQIKILKAKPKVNVIPPETKVVLGSVYTDMVSGYKGTAYGYGLFINGCVRVGLQEKYSPTSEKAPCTGKWFNEGQLELFKEPKKEIRKAIKEQSYTGGPITKSIKQEKGRM